MSSLRVCSLTVSLLLVLLRGEQGQSLQNVTGNKILCILYTIHNIVFLEECSTYILCSVNETAFLL